MRAHALIIAALVGACSSTGSKGQKELSGLTGEIDQLTKQLEEGKADLKTTLAEHDAIVNMTDGDLVGHYKKFGKGIERVEKDREGVRQQVQRVKDAAGPYFATWKDSNAKISDPGLRARDAQNMEATRGRYEEIYKQGDAAKAAYEPLMKTIKDHYQFWSTNLNASSAAEMKKDSEMLGKNANHFYGLIDKVVEAAKAYNKSVAMRVK